MLLKNEIFLKELSEFRERISLIEDLTERSELQNLLGRMISIVKKIDESHEELLYKRPNGSELADLRENLKSTRKQLYSKLQKSLFNHRL
jgi:formate dehydrogenase maturation protein FdhE